MIQFFNVVVGWFSDIFALLNRCVFHFNNLHIPYGWLIVGFLGLTMFLTTFVKGAKA